MQVCLFFFVRNMAGDRAGAVAAAFPALTATLFYSAEGRPYGLLLGMYALALLCWQMARAVAGSRGQGSGGRMWPLIGLAVGACGGSERALLRRSAAVAAVGGRGMAYV